MFIIAKLRFLKSTAILYMLALMGGVLHVGVAGAKPVETIFGAIEEEDPVILKLLDSRALKRLQDVDQSGTPPYFESRIPKFSRYDHSLGVYYLLKKYNAPRREVMAGLMHDASHTVFSHLGDILFQSGNQRTNSYQDDIHNEFLRQMQVDKLLAGSNLAIEDLNPKQPSLTALEQPYPDMNADRIEYNLHTGLLFKDLSPHDIKFILNNLHFENNRWYFSDLCVAKKFAKLSTYYTLSFWGSHHNVAFYTASAALVRHAFSLGLLTVDDFMYGTDQEVLKKLTQCKDPQLQSLLALLRNIDNHFERAHPNAYHIYQPVKMRGIDPLVKQDNQLHRLTELSVDYQVQYEQAKRVCNEGVYIRFKDLDPNTLRLLKQANV